MNLYAVGCCSVLELEPVFCISYGYVASISRLCMCQLNASHFWVYTDILWYLLVPPVARLVPCEELPLVSCEVLLVPCEVPLALSEVLLVPCDVLPPHQKEPLALGEVSPVAYLWVRNIRYSNKCSMSVYSEP